MLFRSLTHVKWKNPPALLATTETGSYSDRLFEFGKSYVYFVRSVTASAGNAIESDDSAPALVTPRDTFPPSAPQNVVAAVLPAAGSPLVVDLSWSINVESDLAGYRLYRSEREGELGRLLVSDLLPSPSFRDAAAAPGHRYWYSVTAVDRAGNESASSEPAAVDLTEPSP